MPRIFIALAFKLIINMHKHNIVTWIERHSVSMSGSHGAICISQIGVDGIFCQILKELCTGIIMEMPSLVISCLVESGAIYHDPNYFLYPTNFTQMLKSLDKIT